MTRSLALAALLPLALAGCQSVQDFADPLAPDIVQEAGLGDAILNSGDANSAVTYFERAAARNPETVALQRNLARSYLRVGKLREAQKVYDEIAARGAATAEDSLENAFIAVRLDDWERASAMSSALPADHESARRALLEALLADRAQDWAAADAAYARAAAGAEDPAEAINNWGVSRMARGDLEGAAATFERALSIDPDLFAAKNNLVIARALRGDYTLPGARLTDAERAVLTNNMALVAQRRGDRAAARRLYETAVALHPQHYAAAADRLARLDAPEATP